MSGMLALILLALALLVCLVRLRRPDHSALCGLALALALAGWALVVGLLALRPLADGAALRGAGFIGAVLCSLGAALLAALGLMTARRQGLSGVGEAAAALLLGLGLLAAAGIEAYRGVSARLAGLPTSRPSANPSAEPVLLEAANVRFRPPGPPWARVDPRQFHPTAQLAFVRAEPALVMLLVADAPGIERGVTNQTIRRTGKALAETGAGGARILDAHPHTIGGLSGVRWFTTARIGDRRMSYVQWGCARRGYTYQLLLWGQQRHLGQIRRAAERLFAGFAILDPERVAHAREGPVSRDVISPRFGYRIALADTPWAVQPDPGAGNAAADLYARYGDRAALVVMPVDLGPLRPPLDLLTAALLAQLKMPFPGPKATPINWQGTLGYRLETVRTAADGVRYHYRMRVLRRDGLAWLLVGWTPHPADTPRLEGALDRFGAVDPDRRRPMTPREQETQARVLNKLGVRLFAGRRPAEATRYLRAAYEVRRNDPVKLANLVAAWRAAGRRAEAAAYLELELARFPENETLRGLAKALKRR